MQKLLQYRNSSRGAIQAIYIAEYIAYHTESSVIYNL
jgi:hypothetical protein